MPEEFDIGFVGAVGRNYDRRTRAVHALERRFHLNDYRRRYDPQEMVAIYARSRMVFNCSGAGDLNMRVFEVLGSGRLLLTDSIDNGLNDLFVDGEHLVTYRDEVDLIERVEYYLARPAERQRVAAAGQALALEHHTYAHRARQIVDQMTSPEVSRASAPARRWSDARLTTEYARIYSMLRAVDPTFSRYIAARRASRVGAREAIEVFKAAFRRLRDG